MHREPPNIAVLAALIATSTDTAPYAAARMADELTRLARQLRAVYTRACDGYQDHRGRWDEVAADRDQRRALRLINKALALVDKPIHLVTQGDPRGPSMRIWIEGHERYNSENEVFAIY